MATKGLVTNSMPKRAVYAAEAMGVTSMSEPNDNDIPDELLRRVAIGGARL